MLSVSYLTCALSDYINQAARFEVLEGFGCNSVTSIGGFDPLFIRSWSIVLPLISTLFYCRKSFDPLGSI
jgi:hypothetical protein